MSPTLSVVTPAWREEANLRPMYGRLRAALDPLGLAWEWIVVDDHSDDGTAAVVKALAAEDPRVSGVRLARNQGSHTAITCGVRLARGAAVVALAADLQDPPEIVPDLLARWRAGAQVVWAVRSGREGQGAVDGLGSRLYYLLMRRVVGLRDMPPEGADVFLLDRVVADALERFPESHLSLFALLSWIGFRQERVSYVKQARVAGRSGWTFRRKLGLVLDSLTAFSHVPLRLMTWVGVGAAFGGLVFAAEVVRNWVVGHPTEGWSSLMVVVLVMGGLQMVMSGILGEYLWRTLEEARRRPRYLVEEVLAPPGGTA